jgi:hypothetical protein
LRLGGRISCQIVLTSCSVVMLAAAPAT